MLQMSPKLFSDRLPKERNDNTDPRLISYFHLKEQSPLMSFHRFALKIPSAKISPSFHFEVIRCQLGSYRRQPFHWAKSAVFSQATMHLEMEGLGVEVVKGFSGSK